MNGRRWATGVAVGAAVVMVVASLGLGPSAGSAARVTHGGNGASPRTAIGGLPAPRTSAMGNLPAGERGTEPRIAPPPTPHSSQSIDTAPTNSAARVLGDLAAKGVPAHDIYLPDFAAEVHPTSPTGHVTPSYLTSPAAYGIGDFGLRNVAGTITPYATQTTSLNATFSTTTLEGYTADLSSPDEYGIELNAVLNNVTLFGQSGYRFWTQNVFFVTPSNESIQFVSNIWNWSNPGQVLSSNAFFAAGGSNDWPDFYYRQSAPVPVNSTYSVRLFLNSTLNQGRDEVFFNYSVSSIAGNYSGSYDYAIFNSLAIGGNPALTAAPQYIANGFAYNPVGLPDDFEITLGGPGGGSNFDLFNSVSTYMSLGYLNETTHQYQSVDSAYNVGGETGETSYGVNDAWAQFAGCADCAELNDGPSFQYGLWNITATPAETLWANNPYYLLHVSPSTAFAFVAEGAGVTNLSQFQWMPDNLLSSTTGLVIPQGPYTLIVLAANYDPMVGIALDLSSGCLPCSLDLALTADASVGVYTPLWAFNQTALAFVSSGVDGSGFHLLDNNEYEELGSVSCGSSYGCAYFPWFGTFNDYMFPVFAGIFLYKVGGVDVANPPSFETAFPPGPSFQRVVNYFGAPRTNDLQLVFYADALVYLAGGTVGGWSLAASYFGPGYSDASVQFWNTSDSGVDGNVFETGGMALFLYGGSFNEIWNNSFYTYVPLSSNPYATTAADYGSIGLVDTDWGDANLYDPNDSVCFSADYCDEIWNNLFDTFITATQLYDDPYTGLLPNQYPHEFSQAYNLPLEPGVTNIVGGDYLGGNYWWDYGLRWDPFNVLPYAGINPAPFDELGLNPAYLCETHTALCDGGGGDWYPLTLSPLLPVVFTETGLPSGTDWGVGTTVGQDLTGTAGAIESGTVENLTLSPRGVDLRDPAGTYDYFAISDNPNYAAPDGTFTVGGSAVHVVVSFVAAYQLTITETGLPSGGYPWYGSVTMGDFETSSDTMGSSIVLQGLLPGVYTWGAFTTGAFGAVPASGVVTISANATVSVQFVPEYTVSVEATGLPGATEWSFSYQSTSGGYSSIVTTTGDWINLTLPELTYTWAAGAGGYYAVPGNGVLPLAGNSMLTIAFALAASLDFSETGLPHGTSWTVGITQGTNTSWYTSSASTIALTATVGPFSFDVNATGYAASPSFGSGTLTAGANLEAITFAVATGTLNGTVSPSAASVWVDGTPANLGAGGVFLVPLPVGIHAVEASALGFANYFNNVTVAAERTTYLNVSLTATSSSAGGLGTVGGAGWLLIALFAGIAAVLLVISMALARRGRPPPVASYYPFTGTPREIASAEGSEPWREGPTPPEDST